jgi:hypothetical protein
MEELAFKLQYSEIESDKLFVKSLDKYCEYKTIFDIVPSGYHGIVSENSESNDVRHEAVPKGKTPIIIMSFNKDGYTVHCKKYREYKEWEAKRNPVRYESNLHKNYDSKNIYHTIRLIHMSKELAENKGFNIVRTWDRDFLIDIEIINLNMTISWIMLIMFTTKLWKK